MVGKLCFKNGDDKIQLKFLIANTCRTYLKKGYKGDTGWSGTSRWKIIGILNTHK